MREPNRSARKIGQALVALAATGLVVSAAGPLQAQGPSAYRIVGSSVLVDQSAHWSNWTCQNDLVSGLSTAVARSGLFKVDADGMAPVFFRRHINATLEAEGYTYSDVVRSGGAPTQGGVACLSNQAAGRRLIDDDLSTWWEPAVPSSFEEGITAAQDFSLDGLREWEVLIDLGRLVYVDSVTVVFPAGEYEGVYLGEPVKSFVLLASQGERYPFPLGTGLKFTLIGQLVTALGRTKPAGIAGAPSLAPSLVTRPGSDGRYVQVTFPIAPLDRADWDLNGEPDIAGSFIQYLQLKVTDSDLWRHLRVGSGEAGRLAYEALPPERRGAKVYQRYTAGGVLVELEDDAGGSSARVKYEALPEEKRGPILYYAREVPRIAEIQAWARGDNLALHPELRAGGAYEAGGRGSPLLATDGIYDTEWQANTWSPLYNSGPNAKGTAWWDLGAVFWVDNLSVVNKWINEALYGACYGPNIKVSDGALLKAMRLEQASDFPQLEEGLRWESVISPEHVDNRTPRVRMFQESFALRPVRFLMMRDLDISGASSGRYGALASLAEIQLYGEGYPVSVWVYSPAVILTNDQGGYVRKMLPRISWAGEALVRRVDPVTGQAVERVESLAWHPEVRLAVQTRTSDLIDTTYTYYQVDDILGQESRMEISRQAYDDLVLRWAVWDRWINLPKPHETGVDDDQDGAVDEDEIDLVDNDRDGKIDEDGKKLGRGRQPKSRYARDEALDFVGWSEWSATYLPTGDRYQARVTSPNPRRFLQLRVNLASADPLTTARIRSLRLDLAPPLALELAGEAAKLRPAGMARPPEDLPATPDDYEPPVEVDPLQETGYAYFLRAAGPDPADPEVRRGFDEVLVVCPRSAILRGVRLGTVRVEESPSSLDSAISSTRAVQTQLTRGWARDGDGVFRDAEGQALLVRAASPESLWVRLPVSINRDLTAGRHAVVEVQFSTRAYQEGVGFEAYVRDSQGSDEAFQRVDGETRDATELVESRTSRVSLAQPTGGVIQGLAVTEVATPNGDGANDRVKVDFTLLRLLTERQVEVDFLDLQGRRVGIGRKPGNGAAETTTAVGPVVFEWDGRTADGALVPPGIYLCRVSAHADSGDDERLRLVHIVY